MAGFWWLAALTLRSTAVLAVALTFAMLLRRTTAVARHRLLTVTAAGLLLLPALTGVLPRWELPWDLPPGSASIVVEPRTPPPSTASAASADETTDAAPPAAPEGRRPAVAFVGESVDWSRALGATVVILWLAGVVASLGRLGRALRREARLLGSSRPLEGPWEETLDDARRSLRLPRPVRWRTSEEVHTPLTGGWRRPVVLMPAQAAGWPDERRRLVAQHELVHVARGDALRRLAWRVVAALYWFHPLARLAERQARLASEQACDETVVRLGARPSTYARHLLEIAESVPVRPPAFAGALPMVERSQLERRLEMILDPTPSPRRGRAIAAVGVALLAATVLGAAAASPVRRAAEPVAAVVAAPKPVEAEKPAAKVAPVEAPSTCERRHGNHTGIVVEGNTTETDDGYFSVQHDLGNGRWICAQVRGPVRLEGGPIALRPLSPGSSMTIETRGPSRSQSMSITGDGPQQYWVNGAPQAIDDEAGAWLADALEVVAGIQEIGSIQGHVGSLQGEIGSIQGAVGSLQGQIGSIQGEIGGLQGKIGSIQGEQGSLEGEIGSHQGAIGSLEASRGDRSSADRERIERRIKEHEAAIKELEAEMSRRDFSGRVSAAEAELKRAEDGARGRIAELEREIQAVQADQRIDRLEREINGLHADDRIHEIERRMRPAVDRLKARIQ